eukprot:jgi/Undpi1/13718/HiC_scaffold_9.g03371.m1
MRVEVKGEVFTVQAGDSIQDALDRVSAGDTIQIENGNYFEDLQTKVDGTKGARITIEAAGGTSDRDNVVLRGTGEEARVFQVMHDYYTIQDFTIDGQAVDDVDDVDSDNYEDSFRDILLFATAGREPSERSGGYMSALDGLEIIGMKIQNAGGECIRLRDIDGNEISDCGLYDFVYNTTGEKNGEGIYIGTASNQWDDGKNYSDDPDASVGNVVRNNIIATHGNEGVDVKEGCLDTIIENNEISMQNDPESGGIASHGDGTIIENNLIENTTGAGVRVGGNEVDGRQYGINNQVIGNTLTECKAYGIKTVTSPQSIMCGNTINLPSNTDEDDYYYSGGDYGDDYSPQGECGDSPSPTPALTPAPTASAGAVYYGCYKDVSGARTMGYEYLDEDNLTNEACIARCKEDNNMFAGTFGGKSCRCSVVDWRVDQHGESDGCTMECPGDASTTCGGDWAVTSWELLY